MILETDRLSLREFAEEDWSATLDYQSTTAYRRYNPNIGQTEEDAHAFVATFLRWQRETPRYRYQWVVTLRGDRDLIGNCGIRKNNPAAADAAIGVELAPQYWGRGYATELGRLILRYGFEELGLHRIHAECVADNAAVTRLPEKLGMRKEGRLRESVLFQDRWCDTLVYGILETEWKVRDRVGAAPPITIRPGTASDRSWILSLTPRLHEFGPPPWRPRGAMDTAVAAAVERGLMDPPPGSIVLIAEDDAREPLGFVHLETSADYFTHESHGHVSDLVVTASQENRGVGRALMQAAEEWARGQSFRLLTLSVFGDNHGARALYERLGYRPDTTKMLKTLDQDASIRTPDGRWLIADG